LVDLTSDQEITEYRTSEYNNDCSTPAQKNRVNGQNRPAYNISRAGSTGDGIIDITESPDIAVWSKGIGKRINVPSDKVKESSKVQLTTTAYITKDHEEKHNSNVSTRHHLKEEVSVDAANRKDVSKVIDLDATLTDEERTFV
jgi:hypothetical protein